MLGGLNALDVATEDTLHERELGHHGVLPFVQHVCQTRLSVLRAVAHADREVREPRALLVRKRLVLRHRLRREDRSPVLIERDA